MRLRLGGGLDLATGALIVGGAALIAASLVAAIVSLEPAPPSPTSNAPASGLIPTGPSGRASITLPGGKVAAVLYVDGTAGAGGAARAGDRVDVLGYFSRQVTSGESVTRVLVPDVPVLTVERSGGSVALTLSVSQDTALLLQEAQAMGAHSTVILRALNGGNLSNLPDSFSDADLAARLAGMP
jgi:hypothetical protein